MPRILRFLSLGGAAAALASCMTVTGADSGGGYYGLLRGTEELLGLPLLGKAATARSLATAFGL